MNSDTWRLALEVARLTDYVRSQFPQSRYNPTLAEQDDNTPPAGSRAYEGRALAFHITDAGREYRITVEDVTLEDEDEEDAAPVPRTREDFLCEIVRRNFAKRHHGGWYWTATKMAIADLRRERGESPNWP